ncbi:hypothetical protein OIU34_19665 [Pararhizobium sp. BT-229]|uniref:hypothetical protein n=1 Tax=Pararhizobium sp. BT-229 TaxID=2986923 RepID=UPI0021F75781|nr:hypothetical protein [Pararhizobium sp. BT-229]MCV9964103.1 hypothetical protein [Pararhizobium sp. BT-229]
MHRHGNRRSPVLDYDDGVFSPAEAAVSRFLCPRCGKTSRREEPELQAGFRMSVRAADALVGVALDEGIGGAASAASIDRSSVSRLVSARAEEYLASKDRPELARLSAESANIVVSDAMSGHAVACFDRLDNPILPNWLSRPTPPVIFPDAEIAPRVMGWKDMAVVSLTKHVFLSMIDGPIRRAARKMAALVKDGMGIDRVSELLASKASSLSPREAADLARMAAPGTPARNFLRLRDRFLGLYDAPGLAEARKRLTDTVNDCTDVWKDIFSPVLEFLVVYRPLILSHPVSLIVRSPSPAMAMKGPASLLTIAISRRFRHEHRHALELASEPTPAASARF